MVGARIKEMFEEAAKDRQREHGGTAPGRKTLQANLPEVNRRARERQGTRTDIQANLPGSPRQARDGVLGQWGSLPERRA